jgi:cytochrome c peroxidase
MVAAGHNCAWSADAPPTAQPGGTGDQETVVLGSADLTGGIPGAGALTTPEIVRWLDDPRNHRPLVLQLPLGLDVLPNRLQKLEHPLTRARIELGRQLFFDARLSADGSVSCASCHNPEHGYTIPQRFATGIRGQQGKRNPPTLYNRIMFGGLGEEEFWDGHAATIEDAVLIAITDPTEMGASLEHLVKTLRSTERYRLQFERIYGRVTIAAVGDAMAAFTRCLVTGPSAYDYHQALSPFEREDLELMQKEEPRLYERYQRLSAAAGNHPMSPSAVRGMQLYFGDRAWCSSCHATPALTDNAYYNTGVGYNGDFADLGRFLVTGLESDKGKFKTPPVRNAALTGPYMHDGSLATLEDVVKWYAQGGRENPNLNRNFLQTTLGDQDQRDIVEFIKACTGELPAVNTGRLPE